MKFHNIKALGLLLIAGLLTAPQVFAQNRETEARSAAGAAANAAPAQPQSASPGTIKFVGKHSTHTNPGTFTNWKFTKVEILGGKIEAGTVELEIDLTSISTDRGGQLNNHLKSPDFFDTASYPTATVAITGAKPVEGKPGKYSANATISIRKAKIETPIEFDYLPDTHQVKGEINLSRGALTIGKPYEPGNGRSIEDNIPVTFEATLPAAAFM